MLSRCQQEFLAVSSHSFKAMQPVESTTIFPDGCKQAANGLPGGLSDGVSARALSCIHDKWMVQEWDPGGVMHANTQCCVSMFNPYAS